MPKACHLITRLIVGGAQRLALETALHAAATGWEIELWAGPQTGPGCLGRWTTIRPSACRSSRQPRLSLR